MRSAMGVGRLVGLALLVQLLLALPVYFVWMRPVTGPDFLPTAVGSALQVRVALLLTLVLGATTFTAAIFGMAASLLSTTAVTMPLLGYRLVFQLVMPAAMGNLALMLWLIVRGFEERQHQFRSDAERVDGLPEGVQ